MDQPEQKRGLFSRIKAGLTKTRESIGGKIENLAKYYREIDDDFFDDLEAILLTADVGVSMTGRIIARLRGQVKDNKVGDAERVREMLRKIIIEELDNVKSAQEIGSPAVILIVGVNGVGKTTTIGKLAHNFKEQGKSVLLAAGDTFRAAAIEQLGIWAQRAEVPMIRHQEGADPAAVVFDAVASAKARNTDVLICDTAGRLHNKKNLMEELKKIHRVIEREYPQSQRETWLVLDATTGQNALQQAKLFAEAADFTGLVLTKLDGSAKGGVVVAIMAEMAVPVRFVGVGEGVEDLQPFDPRAFVEGMI